jgi:multiple antibiotic resistance protein
MLLAGRAGGDPLALAGLMAIVALAIAVVFAVFLAAERFSRWLGATGAVVLSRMLGVVLAALAVQFVIDGVVSVVRAGGG